MGLKFWKRNKADCQITHIIKRIKSKELDGYIIVKKESVSSKAFDAAVHCTGKNQNILIIGGARSGKTTLGEYLCLKLPERKIVISFKKFLPNGRDFDVGYHWIDVAQHLPNLFADSQSFIEAFRTAFFSDLSMRGLMIDVILDNVQQVMNEKPKDFAEFYRILEKLAGRGQWQENIKIIIKSKVQLLERATAGAKLGNIDLSKGNIVLDLGSIVSEEVKTFLAETFLRQINRIEEQTQRDEKIYIVVDEIWHLLRYKAQNSIVGTILLQGAYYIHFLCITQNYTHLDEDYRSHFGTIFCFRNHNDADASAIEKGYSALFKEAVQKLDGHEFIDLQDGANDDIICVFELRYENLARLKIEAKELMGELVDHVFYPIPVPIAEKVTETKEEVNLEAEIIETLKKSQVAMYGYQIAKEIGLTSKDAVKIRQPLRKLVKEEKIVEDLLQLRKKKVIYYSITNTEQFHELMIRKVEDVINGRSEDN